MKFRNIYRIFGSLFLLAACWSCGLEADEDCLSCTALHTTRVHVDGVSEAGLATPLYIFRRAAKSDGEYVFESGPVSIEGGTALKLPVADLARYDYRFMMLAQPRDGEFLALGTAAGTALVAGTAWSDLRLESTAGKVSADGFCGFTDRTGDDILREGTIRLTLKRVAGQVLFDFFRTDGSLSHPVSVVSPDVASVLDRVAKIEITYERVTTALRFDAIGRLVPATYASQSLTQTILPRAEQFRVALPQADLGLAVYDPALLGSLRIEGAFLLPSDSKLRVGMVFTYYDTTPDCGNVDKGDHTADCFALKRVTLHLPASASQAGLPVASDCFTVNRAGLRCDRIIDVPVSGGIESDFDWL